MATVWSEIGMGKACAFLIHKDILSILNQLLELLVILLLIKRALCM